MSIEVCFLESPQLGLTDLLLQIESCRADLIMNDVELTDSACLLKNIPDNLADNSIYFFGTIGGGAIAVASVLGAVIALVDDHATGSAVCRVMRLSCRRCKNAVTAVTAINGQRRADASDLLKCTPQRYTAIPT